MTPPSVSVVIPARNAASTLGLQLEALAAQQHDGAWEVVVVDDRSTDGTAELARSWADRLPTLRVVTGPGAGVSPARNAGVRAAAGERILLCDADDIVAPGWVAALSGALEHADVAGGRLDVRRLNPWTASQPEHVRTNLPTMLGYLPYAVGCNVGFRRSAFDALGGFDESFPPGSEDADFSWRAQQQGFTVAFCGDAVVHYRLRRGLRPLLRQQYGYGIGAARLRAAHTGPGRMAPETRRAQARRLGSQVKALLRPGRLTTPAGRHRYVRSLGWLAGSVRALFTYRVLA